MVASRKKSDRLTGVAGQVLARHVPPGARLRLAFSGGLDSTVLLHILADLRQEYVLSAMHIHHGLSEHADEWETFCRGICDRLQVPLDLVRVAIDRKPREGIEAAARNARYAALMQPGADAVVMAHHADDQAETILFQLLRGGGPRALAAMPETRRFDNGMLLVRPLLDITRQELEAYAHKHGLRWVEDESNTDPRFTRNALRHDVMPAIARHMPDYRERLAAASRRMAETAELLDDLANVDGQEAGLPERLNIDHMAVLSETRARNLLAYYLRLHGVPLPSPTHLAEMLRQILQARTRLRLELPNGQVLTRVERHITIRPSGLE